ncbi:hypothetical protein ABKN59_001561 [Abortiporus biennis]
MAMYCIVWQGFTSSSSKFAQREDTERSGRQIVVTRESLYLLRGYIADNTLKTKVLTHNHININRVCRLPNNNFHSFALTSLTWFVPRDDDSFVGVNLLSSFMILPISPLRSPPWRCGVEGRGGVDSKCDQTRRECQPRHWTVFI